MYIQTYPIPRYVHVYICTCKHESTYIYIYTHTSTNLLCLSTYTCKHEYIYIYTHACMHVYTYICIYIYVYTYRYTCFVKLCTHSRSGRSFCSEQLHLMHPADVRVPFFQVWRRLLLRQGETPAATAECVRSRRDIERPLSLTEKGCENMQVFVYVLR